MQVIELILPELFLSISILTLLILGAFVKKNYKIVQNLTLIVLLFTMLLFFNLPNENIKLFNQSFIIDDLSIFMKILTLVSCFFVMISSNEYIKTNSINNFEYPILILSSLLGMMIMISSYDLIIFYMGLELQSLSLYVLSAIKRDNIRSSEAGLKFFVLSALSSGLLLYGCALIYGFTGSTNFDVISDNLKESNIGSIFGVVFIITGLAFKISAVPFHMWAPDVYEGSPTSVTSFLVLVPKIAAISIIIRFMYVPFINIINQWQLIIIFLSIASMVLGAVAAIGQSNIKRLMAYSSIGHMGYALAGIATGTISGINSTIIYLIIYLIMNLGVFACIFSMRRKNIYFENIDDLAGLSKQRPLLSFGFLIFMFSLAGVPPLAGFFAKFYIFMAVIESKMYLLAIIGLVTTVVSAFYYLRIVKIIYFDESIEFFEENRDLGIKISLVLSCLAVLLYFVYPSVLTDLIPLINIK